MIWRISHLSFCLSLDILGWVVDSNPGFWAGSGIWMSFDPNPSLKIQIQWPFEIKLSFHNVFSNIILPFLSIRIRVVLTIWYRSGSGYLFMWSDPDPRCLRPDPQPWYREPIAQNWCWLYIIYYSQNIIMSNIRSQNAAPSPVRGRIYYFAKRGRGGGGRLI